MGTHSIADAKRNLSRLIERALEGEDVVITRSGYPVVALRPVSQPTRTLSPEAIERLRRRRVGKRMPRTNAVAGVRSQRSEWTR
jgi:prevent-host-death family protein